MMRLLFEFYLSTDIDNIIAVEVGSLLGVFLFLLALTVTVKPLANVVGNRLCEKNLHFYFNFTNPIPYSHGVRRQQTDQMFPCKEKSICYKRRKCYEKDFVSEKDYRYSRHSGHDLCDGCRRFYRRTYQRLLHAHRRDPLPIICRSPVPPTRWISGIDGTAPGALGRPPPQADPIKNSRNCPDSFCRFIFSTACAETGLRFRAPTCLYPSARCPCARKTAFASGRFPSVLLKLPRLRKIPGRVLPILP